MTDARRPVSKPERELVRWLLEHAAREETSQALLATVDGLHVIDACDCGCPSLDFVREGQGAGAQILADGDGTLTDGSRLTVLLWGRDGAISGLEVFDYDGGTWFPLPIPGQLTPARQLRSTLLAAT